MSSIHHEIRHGLTLDQANQAAHLALDDYLQRYHARGLNARWLNDTRAEIELVARGAHLRAVVDVRGDVLHIDAEVPLLLRAFKALALAAIERETQKWIARVKEQGAGGAA